MPKYTPDNNLIAGAAASLATALGGHFMISYGIPITPELATYVPPAVGLIAAHVWDVCTGDNVRGEMTPPPEQKP